MDPDPATQEQRRQYGALYDRAVAIRNKAEDEKRDLTTEENADLHRIETRLDALAADIKRHERAAPDSRVQELQMANSALHAKMCALGKKRKEEKRKPTAEETAEWGRMCDEYDARNHEIEKLEMLNRLASALRAPLARIEEKHWPCSHESVQCFRDSVARKIAEETFKEFIMGLGLSRLFFQGLKSLSRERKACVQAASALRKVPRISDEAEVAFGFHRGLPAVSEAVEDMERRVRQLDRSVEQRFYNAHYYLTIMPAKQILDRVYLRLGAILTHATKLTERYIFKEAMPPILDAIWLSCPDIAPKRGKEDPYQRYRVIKRMLKKDAAQPGGSWIVLIHQLTLRLIQNRFLKLRESLFKNDDRFPASLFEVRPSKRTVDHRAPTKRS